MPGLPNQLTFKEVLKMPTVRRLWAAQLVSIFGDLLAVFAVFSVVTFQMHGTPTQVSWILGAYLLPLAIISPVAGVYVDKWNVKWTMITSDLVRGLLVLVLLFAPDLNTIYGVFLALSTVSSFFVPAQSVAVRALVPATGLMAVNALMSQAVQGTTIVSPAIAGLMVQWFGANSCFIFDSFSFFVSAALVMTIPIHRQPAPAGTAPRSVLSSMGEGMRFIFSHAAISFVILSMTAGMFAVRCFGALLSVYVRDILRSSPAMFGTLNSLIGIGMITGTQSLHRFARKVPPQYLVISGLGGMGLGSVDHRDLRPGGHHGNRHARVGLLCRVHHDSLADTVAAGNTAGAFGTRHQQFDVAIGIVAGGGDVRSRTGSGKGWDPQPVFRQCGLTRRDRGRWISKDAEA